MAPRNGHPTTARRLRGKSEPKDPDAEPLLAGSGNRLCRETMRLLTHEAHKTIVYQGSRHARVTAATTARHKEHPATAQRLRGKSEPKDPDAEPLLAGSGKRYLRSAMRLPTHGHTPSCFATDRGAHKQRLELQCATTAPYLGTALKR